MRTQILATALAFGLSAMAGAEALKFTPISGTNNYCYVVLYGNQTGYFSSETYDLTGMTEYFFNRSAYLPASPDGGYAWQSGEINQNYISVIAHVETYRRASVSSGASFRFRTSAPTLDILTDGTYSNTNYMDTTSLYVRDRTNGGMLRYVTNYSGRETVRVNVDTTHEFEVYVGTNHNNIYQGPEVGTHVLHTMITVRPATNYLMGMVTLQDVVPTPMGDRMVQWRVVQNGINVGSGQFPTMGTAPFELPISASLTGPADLILDTETHLRKTVPVTLGGMQVQVGPVSLVNGDVDSSGEVDAIDIDEVIAHFGSTAWSELADVDLSGEVDAIDIDIVIANFGSVDQ